MRSKQPALSSVEMFVFLWKDFTPLVALHLSYMMWLPSHRAASKNERKSVQDGLNLIQCTQVRRWIIPEDRHRIPLCCTILQDIHVILDLWLENNLSKVSDHKTTAQTRVDKRTADLNHRCCFQKKKKAQTEYNSNSLNPPRDTVFTRMWFWRSFQFGVQTSANLAWSHLRSSHMK